MLHFGKEHSKHEFLRLLQEESCCCLHQLRLSGVHTGRTSASYKKKAASFNAVDTASTIAFGYCTAQDFTTTLRSSCTIEAGSTHYNLNNLRSTFIGARLITKKISRAPAYAGSGECTYLPEESRLSVLSIMISTFTLASNLRSICIFDLSYYCNV